MSNALQKFNKTINRCEAMINVYQQMKDAESTDEFDIQVPQDILRGAIVLAVAAFDAYATDKFSENFVQYIKKHSIDPSLEKLLADAGLTIKFALELIDSDRPYRKIRTLIDRYYAKYSAQKLKVVDDLFLQYRIPKLTENAARLSGKNVRVLLGSVEKIIARRHSIVHDGDYNDHGQIKNVAAGDVKRIDDLKTLVNNMDTIINNRCR